MSADEWSALTCGSQERSIFHARQPSSQALEECRLGGGSGGAPGGGRPRPPAAVSPLRPPQSQERPGPAPKQQL